MIGQKDTSKSIFHMDGWKNVLSGLGKIGRDKTTGITAGDAPTLPTVDLTSMYKGDGIAHRIIDCVADDMVRAGWVIPQDEENSLGQPQQMLRVKKVLNQALKWSRLYGGCIVAMDIVGAGAWEDPINKTASKAPTLRGFRIYPSPRIELQESDFNTDPDSPYFEEVEVYRVQKRIGGEFKIHTDRCLVFKGLDSPDVLDLSGDIKERYWGMSALQPLYDHLKILGAFLQGIGVLGEEFSIAKIKLSNLEELIAESNFADIQKRTEVIAVTKSLINAVLLGEGEEYNRDNVTFTGIPELLDRFYMVVAGDAGIPVTRLFGRSAAGENATGENDEELYRDTVASDQEVNLLPELYKLLQYLNVSEGSPVNAEELTVEFSPLQTPSETEEATNRKLQAETDEIYINSGVLESEEVRTNRFVGDYSSETTVEARPEGYTPEKTLTPEEAALVALQEKNAKTEPLVPKAGEE